MKQKKAFPETHPFLVKEWNFTKNEKGPENYTYGSNERVHWICKEGHEWEAMIKNRSRGFGCPYCSGQKVTKGTSLGVLNPYLAKEWHPTKNGNIKPVDVMPFSIKKVWWLCDKGHEWPAIVNNRSRGASCPYCRGRYATSERNLLIINPELSKQWHPTKNRELQPSDVLPGSNKKVWWRCENNHEWESTIKSRVNGASCKDCRKDNKKRKKG